MQPISLKDYAANPKSYKGQDNTGVYFIFKANKSILSQNIPHKDIKRYDKDIMYIGTSSTSYFARLRMHIKSFSAITENVETPPKFVLCAQKNGNTIDNLYVVCYKGLDKETENNRFKNDNGNFPCANTRAK